MLCGAEMKLGTVIICGFNTMSNTFDITQYLTIATVAASTFNGIISLCLAAQKIKMITSSQTLVLYEMLLKIINQMFTSFFNNVSDAPFWIETLH